MKRGERVVFRPLSPVVLLTVLSLLILVFHAPFRSPALTVIRFPFVMAKGLAQTLWELPQLPTLDRQNRRLREALMRDELESTRLQETLRQLQSTQALREAHPAFGGILAEVVGRSILPTQHTLLLDQGAHGGLRLGAMVLDGTGVVGRLIEVHPTTSLVLLLTDPDSRIAGLIERSREAGLLVGTGRGTCEFRYLDATADVQVGDRVVTAGLSDEYPKGLLLGSVMQLRRDEIVGTVIVWVTPAAAMNRVEEVLCVHQ